MAYRTNGKAKNRAGDLESILSIFYSEGIDLRVHMSKVQNINDLYHGMSLLLQQDAYDQLIDSQTLLLLYSCSIDYSEKKAQRPDYPAAILVHHRTL